MTEETSPQPLTILFPGRVRQRPFYPFSERCQIDKFVIRINKIRLSHPREDFGSYMANYATNRHNAHIYRLKRTNHQTLEVKKRFTLNRGGENITVTPLYGGRITFSRWGNDIEASIELQLNLTRFLRYRTIEDYAQYLQGMTLEEQQRQSCITQRLSSRVPRETLDGNDNILSAASSHTFVSPRDDYFLWYVDICIRQIFADLGAPEYRIGRIYSPIEFVDSIAWSAASFSFNQSSVSISSMENYWDIPMPDARRFMQREGERIIASIGQDQRFSSYHSRLAYSQRDKSYTCNLRKQLGCKLYAKTSSIVRLEYTYTQSLHSFFSTITHPNLPPPYQLNRSLNSLTNLTRRLQSLASCAIQYSHILARQSYLLLTPSVPNDAQQLSVRLADLVLRISSALGGAEVFRTNPEYRNLLESLLTDGSISLSNQQREYEPFFRRLEEAEVIIRQTIPLRRRQRSYNYVLHDRFRDIPQIVSQMPNNI